MRICALILAGGFGKRLAPLTLERPKPMIEVAGKPILVWQLEWLRSYGITDVVVAVGYLRHKVFESVGDGRKFGVRLYYSVEEEPLGTGGAIKNASHFLENFDVVVVTNGDVITDIPIGSLLEKLGGNVLGSIALVPMRSPYGIVEVDEEGFIRSFVEKPQLGEYLINAGVYALKKEVLQFLPDKGDVEETTFPKLAAERRLVGVVFRNVFWKSIDTVKDLEEAERMLSRVKLSLGAYGVLQWKS